MFQKPNQTIVHPLGQHNGIRGAQKLTMESSHCSSVSLHMDQKECKLFKMCYNSKLFGSETINYALPSSHTPCTEQQDHNLLWRGWPIISRSLSFYCRQWREADSWLSYSSIKLLHSKSNWMRKLWGPQSFDVKISQNIQITPLW